MDDWFQLGLKRKLGKGNRIKFWEDVWVGNLSLKESFPRLFGMTEDRGKLIEEVGAWQGDTWVWKLGWRRQFFNWEEALVLELTNLLHPIILSRSIDDEWIWIVCDSDSFSSNSAYKLLQLKCSCSEPVLGVGNNFFKYFWNCKAPTKILAFPWQVILDRLPTKSNLALRNVLQGEDNSSCCFCDDVLESAGHLFLSCNFSS